MSTTSPRRCPGRRCSRCDACPQRSAAASPRRAEACPQAVQTLAAPLPVSALGTRPPAARSPVADPLEDLERLGELLALIAEQLPQLGALLVGQSGGGEASEPRRQERPGEESHGEVASHLIDARSQIGRHDAAVSAAQRQEPRAVHSAAALGLLPRPARARVVAPGWGSRRVEVDVGESHRQHRNGGVRDEHQRGHTGAARLAGRSSVCDPATLAVPFLCGAGRRPCIGRSGCPPVFLVSEAAECGGPLHGGAKSEPPAPADRLNRRPRSADARRRCRPAPSVPVPRSR